MVGTHCGNRCSELVVSTYSRDPLLKPVVGTNEWNIITSRNLSSETMAWGFAHDFRPWLPTMPSDYV